VVVKRHVPIREWEESHQWLALRPELEGALLGVDSSIVKHLEKIRHLVRVTQCVSLCERECECECVCVCVRERVCGKRVCVRVCERECV
jgi:hypothetical protein